jgi:hypothetical protein
MGTRGVNGVAKKTIDESRGRIVRILCQRRGVRRVLPHVPLIMKIFATVEVKELYGA